MDEVPFVDLKKQYEQIKTEIDQAIADVISSCAFIRGPYVQQFEKDFAQLLDAPYCVSCANGTDAIYISLKSLGLQPGDEVIVPALTWIATSETVTQAGGRVVFADIDPNDFTIDPDHVKSLITSKTKAIIPVHLYGQPAKMDELLAIAEANGLSIVEDCAQAHLAAYKDRLVGTMGSYGTFSFYPGKNLGAYGDAGAMICQEEALSIDARMFANHGADRHNKHEHQIEGVNSRLDGLQVAILSVKCKYIHDWTNQRIQNAGLYNQYLKDCKAIQTPLCREEVKHVYHLYVIKTKERDALRQYLSSHGIATGVQYPCALPFLKAYEYLGHGDGDFPVAKQCTEEILSLPMFPEMSEQQIQYVAEKIIEFYQ